MDTSEIQYKYVIHKDPKIIIAGEFKYDLVPVAVFSIRRLYKIGLHRHPVVVVVSSVQFRRCFDLMDRLSSPRLVRWKRLHILIIYVRLVGIDVCQYPAERHKMAVRIHFYRCSELIVDRKLTGGSIQIRIVLC